MQPTNTPQKLFNLPILLFIITILLLLLLALFPWSTAKYMGQQGSDLLREQFSSRLKTQYYQVLKSFGKDTKKTLDTAYLLREKGLLQASTHLLTEKIVFNELSQSEQLRHDLILLANHTDSYHKASGLMRDNRQLLFKIRVQLQKLEQYDDLSNSELQTIAEASADFGLLPLSINFYHQLANNSPAYRAQWLAEAGKWANQSGDYAEAAKAFKLASDTLKPHATFNQYTEKWLNATVKANQVDVIKPFFTAIENKLPQSPIVVKKLADISVKAGLYTIASQLFNHLALHDQIQKKQRWYEKASYWSYKAENYDSAANYLIKAKQITNSGNDRWSIQQRLINIYIKGKKPKQALTILLPMLREIPDNQKLVDKAIQIALENNKILIARELNKSYLQGTPNSLNALNNQINIEVFDKKYTAAIFYLKKLIKITPNAIKPRQQWAQLEEHQGNYQLALELWQWIYKASKEQKHLQKIIQLAQGSLKKEGLNTLRHIALQQELPRQAVFDVFFHLVNSGKKKSAEKFLKNYLDIHKTDRKLLETLAQWYAGEKRYKKSLQTWKQVEKSFGSTKTSRLNRFELLWASRHKHKAHRLWKKYRHQWLKKANSRQLSIMAEVAWQYKHRSAALSYYNRLINKRYKRSQRERTLQYTRIAILHKKLGHPKKALSIYRKGFIKTQRTELLINGLQLSFDQRDQYNFKRLTTLAKKHRRRFRSKSRYWLLQAAHAQQSKNYKTALKYYRKALSLKPNSREARSGVKSIRKYLKNA